MVDSGENWELERNSRGCLGILTQWEEKKQGQRWGEGQRGCTPLPRLPSPAPLLRLGTHFYLCFFVRPASGWLFRGSHQESEERSQLDHQELKIPSVSFQLHGPAAGKFCLSLPVTGSTINIFSLKPTMPMAPAAKTMAHTAEAYFSSPVMRQPLHLSLPVL